MKNTILSLLCLLLITTGVKTISYTSRQQIFVGQNTVQELTFEFANNYDTEEIISTLHLENVRAS